MEDTSPLNIVFQTIFNPLKIFPTDTYIAWSIKNLDSPPNTLVN
jgi:hypothetical protein